MAWTARPLTNYVIEYASGAWNGSAWIWGSGASPTTQGGTNQNPALAQLPNGTLYLFWAYKAAASKHYQVYYLTQNAGVFSKVYTPLPLASPTTLNDTFTSASVGKDGSLWVVWTRDNTTASGTGHVMRQLWYETLSPGAGRFSIERALTSANDVNWNFQSSVVLGKDGIVRVAFSRGQASLGIFQIYYMTYNGSAWSSMVQLTTQTTTQDSNPSFMQDRNGTLWIFWGRNVILSSTSSSYTIYVRSSANNAATWTTEVGLTAPTCTSSGCVDSEYPAAVQSTADKNIWVFYATDPSGSNFNIWGLETTRPIFPVHDVRLMFFSPNASELFAGGFYDRYTPYGVPIIQSPVVQILVSLQNVGDFNETVTLSLTATNTTRYMIGVQVLQVLVGSQSLPYFYFNTTGVRPARYGISGNASITVATVGNKPDGLLSTPNMIHLDPWGDVDQDGADTISDVSIVLYNYGFTCYTVATCSPRYVAAMYGDINGNGIIDIVDVGVVLKDFGLIT